MRADAHRGVDPYARLTSLQSDAVFAPESRVAVYAGAGAGKTRVLTLRVARLVDEGVDPSHILVVTFSRKAAQELRRRLWKLGVEGVRAGTFHRTALELIEISRAERGQGPPQLITDRRRALARVAATFPTIRNDRAGAQLDTEVTWAKSVGLTPESYSDAARQARRRPSLGADTVALVWERYEKSKRSQGLLDFDDLILEANRALEDPRFAEAIHWRSRHVLVDEFQDVNPMQFELVERLMTPTTTLFCVGDPNQSIYGFNGANPTLLRNLNQRFDGTRLIVLDANHRSTPEIVAAAAAVLPASDQRETRSTQQGGSIPEIVAISDDRAEAAYVASRSRSMRGPNGRWRSIAVLARTNAQLDAFEEAFAAAGVPAERLAPDLSRASDVRSPTDAARPGSEAPPRSDAVALGTFHRAKGLEWPTVFVVGAADGMVPHAAASSPEAMDEERRLLHVALTRAERDLVVTWAARRDGDESSSAPPRRRSPYLDPFDQALAELAALQRPSPSASSVARVSALRHQLLRRKAEQEATEETPRRRG